MSGNPATKSVYASVVTRVEITPDNVDLTDFPIQFWPGKILLDLEDPRSAPRVVDYQDGPLTFRVEQCRVAIGKVVVVDGEEVARFDEAHEHLFRLLRQGAEHHAPDIEKRAQAEVDAFAQELAEFVERAGASEGLGDQVVEKARNFVRNRARRAAAGG